MKKKTWTGHVAKYKNNFSVCKKQCTYKDKTKHNINNVAIRKKIKPDMPKNNLTGQNRLHKIQKYKNKKIQRTSKNIWNNCKHSLFPFFCFFLILNKE